jgi:hypothetical protein
VWRGVRRGLFGIISRNAIVFGLWRLEHGNVRDSSNRGLAWARCPIGSEANMGTYCALQPGCSRISANKTPKRPSQSLWACHTCFCISLRVSASLREPSVPAPTPASFSNHRIPCQCR